MIFLKKCKLGHLLDETKNEKFEEQRAKKLKRNKDSRLLIK